MIYAHLINSITIQNAKEFGLIPKKKSNYIEMSKTTIAKNIK